MIKSMTGYGYGESTGCDWRCTVELKAVNHRYCDISVRMPSIMNPHEDKVRKMLAKEIKRGKIDAYIRIDSFGQHPVKIDINFSAADAYVKAISRIKERYKMPDQLTLALLTGYQDVFTVDKTLSDEVKNQIWTVLERTIEAAAERLNEMRAVEGEILYADILKKRARLLDLLTELKARLPDLVLEYEKRLRKRIDEVIAQLPEAKADENRLMAELALYAERTAVDEEVIRLESHLKQLDQIVTEKESVGRKLDFLIQEMHREVNTIGSKTNDIIISKLVIDMKSEIEKIREQVQNVE